MLSEVKKRMCSVHLPPRILRFYVFICSTFAANVGSTATAERVLCGCAGSAKSSKR